MKEQLQKAWNEGYDLQKAITASRGSVFEEKTTFTKMLDTVEVDNGIGCAGFINMDLNWKRKYDNILNQQVIHGESMKPILK